MLQVFTSGYEGETINQFIVKLLDQKIDTLVDIRENPFSRKKGFSKKDLDYELNGVGIEYKHFQELGTPRPLRDFLKESNNYPEFFSRYKEYINEFKESLYDLIDLSQNNKICLLCFEKDPHFCHRKVISDLIEEYSGKHITVVHL